MLDYKSFDKIIWEKGIVKLLRYYCEKIDGLEYRIPESEIKKNIWDNYCEFNKQCREYMSETVKRLDRHKVVACYIFAIIKSDPFKYKKPVVNDCLDVATEQMAISIGLKIFQGFLTSKKDRNNNDKPKEKYKEDLEIFGNGFLFPGENEVNHGEYRNNFAIELYYTAKEDKYNILSLSHSLYLLEMYNRKSWELKKVKK